MINKSVPWEAYSKEIEWSLLLNLGWWRGKSKQLWFAQLGYDKLCIWISPVIDYVGFSAHFWGGGYYISREVAVC